MASDAAARLQAAVAAGDVTPDDVTPDDARMILSWIDPDGCIAPPQRARRGRGPRGVGGRGDRISAREGP